MLAKSGKSGDVDKLSETKGILTYDEILLGSRTMSIFKNSDGNV